MKLKEVVAADLLDGRLDAAVVGKNGEDGGLMVSEEMSWVAAEAGAGEKSVEVDVLDAKVGLKSPNDDAFGSPTLGFTSLELSLVEKLMLVSFASVENPLGVQVELDREEAPKLRLGGSAVEVDWGLRISLTDGTSKLRSG